MDINEEKEVVFKALDFYLRDVYETLKVVALEDLVIDYTKLRNINVNYIEIY